MAVVYLPTSVTSFHTTLFVFKNFPETLADTEGAASSFFFFFFLIKVLFIYIVGLISAVQQGDLGTHT